jgi:hypothetical protein
MQCKNHPEKPAKSFCHHCQNYFCGNCLTVGGDFYFCSAAECQAAGKAERPTEVDNRMDDTMNGATRYLARRDPVGAALFVGENVASINGKKRASAVFGLTRLLWYCVIFILLLVYGCFYFFGLISLALKAIWHSHW